MKLEPREAWADREVNLYWKLDCLFCDRENQKDYIVWSWKYWEIKVNKYPYTWDKYHLLAIPKAHYELSIDIPKYEWDEMYEIHKFVNEYFGNAEYFSMTRETFWSRSLKHLHIHFIKWDSPAQSFVDMIKNN